MGGVNQPLGCLLFPSPLPFLPPSPFPLWCCAKVGGINPPEGCVGNSLHYVMLRVTKVGYVLLTSLRLVLCNYFARWTLISGFLATIATSHW